MQAWDVVVAGGGAGGLGAALWLGRYRRKTLVIDAAEPRNAPATRSHGYLTFDGCSPDEFFTRARADVERYPEVTIERDTVRSIAKHDDGFLVSAASEHVSKRVVLATGVSDVCPDIPGFDELYGKSIFHCSCCDGYESRDMDVVAIGWAEQSAGYALDLLDWGARVTLVTNGNTFEGDAEARSALDRHGIELIEDEVASFNVQRAELTNIVLSSGREIPAQRAFFSIAHQPRNELARSLGCHIDEKGYVVVGDHGETSVEHVYAVGDVTPGEQLVQTAAAEGAVAGIACAMSLRGTSTVEGAPDPGPDPGEELQPRRSSAT